MPRCQNAQNEGENSMKSVDINTLSFKAVDWWKNQWLLLTAGTMDDCNMMTVGWGSIGCMWWKPFIQIVVRPQRYTFEYTEKCDSFTVCGFPPEYREDLQLLGSVSGRDGDKLSKTKLTLKESTIVSSPAYNEATFILECRKMYRQRFDPNCFLDDSIPQHYPNADYHIAYFGEIVAAFAE
jgi:flavin reductase (DIM6/NTAB) family NADH-FMN oxidoreductase RutF